MEDLMVDAFDSRNSFAVGRVAIIKTPSKVLPLENCTTKRKAFHSGVKAGTGSGQFFGVLSVLKELFHLRPKTKRNRLVHEINAIRNEARNACKNIQEQMELFQTSIDPNIAMRAIYFVRLNCAQLCMDLGRIRLLNGLLRGGAVVKYKVWITSDKMTDHGLAHRYVRQHEAEIQLMKVLLEQTQTFLKLPKSKDLFDGVAFDVWTRAHGRRMEVHLQSARNMGECVGIGLRGGITAAIYIGIGVALINPLLIFAGAYFIVTASVRIGGIMVRTHYQNIELRDGILTDASDANQQMIDWMDLGEKAHLTVDSVMQKTVLNVAIGIVTLPVAAVASPVSIVFNSANLIPATNYDAPM